MWFVSCFLRARDGISGGVLWDICNLLCFFFNILVWDYMYCCGGGGVVALSCRKELGFFFAYGVFFFLFFFLDRIPLSFSYFFLICCMCMYVASYM